MQREVQALSQHTRSTQKPLVHCAAAAHEAPTGRLSPPAATLALAPAGAGAPGLLACPPGEEGCCPPGPAAFPEVDAEGAEVAVAPGEAEVAITATGAEEEPEDAPEE